MRVEGISQEIQIIRSARKTMQFCIDADGQAILRVPNACTFVQINRMLTENAVKIEHAIQKMRAERAKTEELPGFTMEEIRAMADRALEWIPPRVAYFAKRMRVTYGRITIRNQKTRWGSCAETGNLNFNCLLMEMPENVRDSVIIHELAHRRHMDHSKAFYEEVYAQMPKAEYDECSKYLKTEGTILLRRMLKT